MHYLKVKGEIQVGFFIGTDVGGTFTDIWVCGETDTRVFKSMTTPDVLGGVINGMKIAAEAYELTFNDFCSQIERLGHGTTISINAMLTGNIAKTVILTTRGFGDTLEIGRVARQTSGLNEIERLDYYLRNRFLPLIPRHRVIELDERIDSNGKIITPLDEAQAREALAGIKTDGIEAIAICTLWSIQNPVHERRLRDIVLEELPGVFVSVSNEISPALGEYARMSTTAANAALGPIAGQYLARLEETLHEAGMKVPVLVMTSVGGVLPIQDLSDKPVSALFSGPAGGVIGSQAIGERIGLKNILSTDIGGTSFDVAVVADGAPLTRSNTWIAGADILVHSIDVESIGAGGGSIASVKFGELQVGPQSAGANPGPACYGKGGADPTLTDADLVLGVLDPDNFIGGSMKLDIDAANRAIHDRVAKPLGLSILAAAWGIREVMDNQMADLLRRMTIEKGYDPFDFTLFANGGAGPSHAWMLAQELGLDGFVAPAVATVASAFGIGNSDLRFMAETPSYIRISPGTVPSDSQIEKVSEALKKITADVRRSLESAVSKGKTSVDWFASVRFRGQSHHLEVSLESETFDLDTFHQLIRRFEEQYNAHFGRGAAFSKAGYELLSVRAIGIGSLPPPSLAIKGEPLTFVQTRSVIFRDPKAPVETAIYRTTMPLAGEKVDGPCIIEFPGQSVVMPPNSRATVDDYGNLHVRWA